MKYTILSALALLIACCSLSFQLGVASTNKVAPMPIVDSDESLATTVRGLTRQSSGGCLRRAFATGLAYMGRTEDLSWIPYKANYVDVQLACERYGLTLIKGAKSFRLDNPNAPVLMIYETEHCCSDAGSYIQHAVFASDWQPFQRWTIFATVIGWDGNHSWRPVPTRPPQLEFDISPFRVDSDYSIPDVTLVQPETTAPRRFHSHSQHSR